MKKRKFLKVNKNQKIFKICFHILYWILIFYLLSFSIIKNKFYLFQVFLIIVFILIYTHKFLMPFFKKITKQGNKTK